MAESIENGLVKRRSVVIFLCTGNDLAKLLNTVILLSLENFIFLQDEKDLPL